MTKADMHIHSFYSDGTYSPEKILEEAKRNHVSVISITDHNCLDGYDSLLSQNEIEVIAGVELDCTDKGINYHVLGYGIDIQNEKFRSFVRKNNEKLEKVNTELLKKVILDHPECSLNEYHNYHYDRKKGGWKLLHYFMEKGLSDSLQDGFRIYAQYHHSYTCGDFPSMKEVCDQIHQAKGRAVLAHPQKVIRPASYEHFEKTAEALLKNGLDGIECYYPSQDEKAAEICVNLCKKYDLMITCGCDCHGDFENTKIGELDRSLNDLNLKDLLPAEKFMFYDTKDLKSEEIFLKLTKTCDAQIEKGWVPAYYFDICLLDKTIIGTCTLRIGYNEKIYIGGNIGYRIEEAYRGHHYALKACLLLFNLARKHGMEKLIITCVPENAASSRTCELAGGKYLETAEIPKENEMYLEGKRKVKVFEFIL